MICQVKQGWKNWTLNYDNEQNISKMIGQVKQEKKLGKLNLFSVKGAEKVVLNRVGGGWILQCNTSAGKTSDVKCTQDTYFVFSKVESSDFVFSLYPIPCH